MPRSTRGKGARRVSRQGVTSLVKSAAQSAFATLSAIANPSAPFSTGCNLLREVAGEPVRDDCQHFRVADDHDLHTGDLEAVFRLGRRHVALPSDDTVVAVKMKVPGYLRQEAWQVRRRQGQEQWPRRLEGAVECFLNGLQTFTTWRTLSRCR